MGGIKMPTRDYRSGKQHKRRATGSTKRQNHSICVECHSNTVKETALGDCPAQMLSIGEGCVSFQELPFLTASSSHFQYGLLALLSPRDELHE